MKTFRRPLECGVLRFVWRRYGFSLLELVIAFFIVGLAIAPIYTLLISTSQVSSASIYEVMAVRYASELAEQLQRLAPHFKAIRLTTTADLPAALEGLNPFLGPASPLAPIDRTKVLGIFIPGTEVAVFVSPLFQNFVKREIQVLPVTPATSEPQLPGQVYNVVIRLGWKIAPSSPVGKEAAYSLLIAEEP